MNNFVKVFVLIATIIIGSACAPEDNPMRNSVEPGYTPDVSLCQVHMDFDYDYYEEAGGYIWDNVHIRNGQANTARVQITFAHTDAEALDKTIGGQRSVNYKIFIEQYEKIDIRVEYKNSHNEWVTCPDGPISIVL